MFVFQFVSKFFYQCSAENVLHSHMIFIKILSEKFNTFNFKMYFNEVNFHFV